MRRAGGGGRLCGRRGQRRAVRARLSSRCCDRPQSSKGALARSIGINNSALERDALRPAPAPHVLCSAAPAASAVSQLELCRCNARVYGVEGKVEFLNGDSVALLRSGRLPLGDVLYLSPPWGGPEYLSAETFDLTRPVVRSERRSEASTSAVRAGDFATGWLADSLRVPLRWEATAARTSSALAWPHTPGLWRSCRGTSIRRRWRRRLAAPRASSSATSSTRSSRR